MSCSPQVVIGRYGRLALLEVDGSIVEHVHPRAHVLIKIWGPNGRIKVAGQEHVLSDDDIVLLNAFVPHTGVCAEGARVGLLAGFIDLPRLSRDRAANGQPARDFALCDTSHTLTESLRSATDTLTRRLVAGRTTPVEADAFLDLLLGEYASSTGRAGEAACRRHVDYRIRRVMTQMRANPGLSRDVTACSRIAGLSRQHFFSLFRQNTGLSPRLFGNSLRLETAMNELSSSSASIQALASDLGFSTPGHFTRFFLHHVGSTPSAFRRGVVNAM